MNRSPKQVPQEVVNGTIFERNVPIDKMFIHFRSEPNGYARPLNERRAAKMAAEFEAQAVGLLLLSMRDDGSYAVIDGQHRREAAWRNGMKALDALVYIDLSVEDEARLYRKFGDYLKQSARDKFFAAVAERQPEALAITRMLGEYGLKVATSSHEHNGVAAVGALLHVAEKQGPQILREAIHLLHDAFDGDPQAYLSGRIVGAAMFLERFIKNPNFSRARLISRMQKDGIVTWHQQMLHVVALERGESGSAYGKVLLAMHDRGVAATRRLGTWPEMTYSEKGLEAVRQTIAKATIASAEKSRNLTTERSLKVECITHRAKIGHACTREQVVCPARTRRAYRLLGKLGA